MKRPLHRVLLALLVALAVSDPLAWSASHTDTCNPQPLQDDLILPLPDGQCMAFRPIWIGAGGKLFSLRRIQLGNADEDFKEYPTALVIGGSFQGGPKDSGDWCYYLAKYEVTESQFQAVMGSPPAKPSSLPVTNISYQAVQVFLDRMNQWLYQNALAALPKYDQAYAFARLPTEAEWEFAVRGGAQVSADDFDRRRPYKGSLAEYEWFEGPNSANGEPHPVGQLKPNPLGLHDMLGNVSEMTASLYQIEYYQGRVGGFTSRGGSFTTSEKMLRSSARAEQPLYSVRSGQALAPHSRPDMGFRPALGALVISSIPMSGALAKAWAEYRAGSGAALPASLSVGSTEAKISVVHQDMTERLGRIKAMMAAAGSLSEEADTQFKLIEATVEDVEHIRKKADKDMALSTTLFSVERGFSLHRETKRIQRIRSLIALAQASYEEEYRRQEMEITQNIDDFLATYGQGIKQLSAFTREDVEAGFELLAKGKTEEQLRCLAVVRSHYEEFIATKRTNPDKWRTDFEKVKR